MNDRVDHRIPDPSVSLQIPNNSTSVFEAPPSALAVSEDVQIDSVAVADRHKRSFQQRAEISRNQTFEREQPKCALKD